MEFKVDRENAKSFLTRFARIVGNREFLAHLTQNTGRQVLHLTNGLKLSLTGNRLKGIATNSEIWGAAEIEVEGMKDGEIVVADARPLAQFISLLEQEEVHFTVENGSLYVQDGKMEAQFLPSEQEFPDLPPFSGDVEWKLQQGLLKEMIRKTVFAAATEPRPRMTPTLMGIHFVARDGHLYAVSTDLYRLVCVSEPMEMPDASFTLPSGTAKELDAWLSSDENELLIRIGSEAVELTLPHATFRCMVLGGGYPDFARVIAPTLEYRLAINRQDFLRALERVSALAFPQKVIVPTVKLTFKDGFVRVEYENEMIGRFAEEIPVEYKGKIPEKTLAFSLNYLIDILEITDVDVVEVGFNNAEPLAKFELDNINYIVMSSITS